MRRLSLQRGVHVGGTHPQKKNKKCDTVSTYNFNNNKLRSYQT